MPAFSAGACETSRIHRREVEEEEEAAVAQHRVLRGCCSFPSCSADLGQILRSAACGCGKAHPDAQSCNGAVFWVQPAVVAQFLGGSFLRKLQATTPSVLLLFMLKVHRFISFRLQFIAINAGQQHVLSLV